MAAGNKLYKSQKYEEAIREYEKVLAFHPNRWDASYMTAISYLSLYHPGSTHPKDIEFAEKAVQSFKKLLDMQAPDTETAAKVRGYYVNLLVQADRVDEAIAFYEKVLEGNPNDVDTIAQIAQLYAKKNDFEKAKEYYVRRAEVDPSNKEAWYTVGVICWERSYRGSAMISNKERADIVAEGLAALEKARTIDPEYMSALAYTNLLWRERAKVLLDAGDVQGAGQAILQADQFQKQALAILNRNKAASDAQGKAGA